MYAIFWPAPYSVPPQFVQCVHKVCCMMFYPLCTPSQRVSAWVSLAAHLIAKQCKERRCKEGSLLENTEHSNNTLIEGELKTNKYIKCHQVTTDNTLILELLNSQRSYFPLSVCVCTITFAFMYIAHKFYISYFQPCIYNIQCTLWAQRGAHSRDISHRWHLATGILRCSWWWWQSDDPRALDDDEAEKLERLHTWCRGNDGAQSMGRRNNYCAR